VQGSCSKRYCMFTSAADRSKLPGPLKPHVFFTGLAAHHPGGCFSYTKEGSSDARTSLSSLYCSRGRKVLKLVRRKLSGLSKHLLAVKVFQRADEVRRHTAPPTWWLDLRSMSPKQRRNLTQSPRVPRRLWRHSACGAFAAPCHDASFLGKSSSWNWELSRINLRRRTRTLPLHDVNAIVPCMYVEIQLSKLDNNSARKNAQTCEYDT